MLPKDPNILFSLLNTKLRDNYPSLSALCDDMEEDQAELEERMKAAGYVYSDMKNCFIKGE